MRGAEKKKRSHVQVMLQLVGLVKPLTGYMLAAVFMGLLGHLCASFITILGGYALLKVLGLEVSIPLWGIFVLVLVFALLRGILRYAEQSCNHFIAFKLLALIRDRVFLALRKLCPAKLEGRDKGDLISVITADIELLEVFYAHTISPAAIAFFFTVIMCGFIGKFHWLLGIIALISYLVIGIGVPVIISKRSGSLGEEARKGAGQLSAFMLDSLRGLPEILQYGAGKHRLEELRSQTKNLSENEEKRKVMQGKNTAITGLLVLLCDMVMLFVAAFLYQSGAIGLEGLLISVLSLFASFGPVSALANLGSTLQNTFAAGNRVLDILEEEPVVEEISGKEEITFQGAAADKVSFSYGKKEEQTLQDVSLEIPRGSIVGIMGRSGSGKSTLLKLFMRFWQVEKGEIILSGRNIEEINTTNLRQMEGFMTQDTHLFHDSIAENLRIAKPSATREEMEKACRQASVHDFIMSLPEGYDTPVGELGETLSGGERQRLGLARAFLQDAPFLLLDEPTSNLDSLNEAIILKSLREEKAERTVLLVSHRESTMRIADKVYKVDAGAR